MNPDRMNPDRMNPDRMNPELEFATWFEQATALDGEPAARCFLATCSLDGRPSVRVVFHRPGASRRVRFFTNYESRKGLEIAANPQIAVAFHWPQLDRQARLEGSCVRTSAADSDAYFAARPRESQLAARLSQQSQPIASVTDLRAQHAQILADDSSTWTRPPHWGGYELIPDRIEFWTAGAARLHERVVWKLTPTGWQRELLSP
jgi:pyridoxamine 5'-phosphate oxidase